MSRISCMPAGSRPFIGSSRMSSWGSPEDRPRPEALAHSHGVLRHLDTAATQHAHAVERGVDAVSRGRLTSGRKDLQVLAAREMTMKSRFVDDCTDPSEPPRRGASARCSRGAT